MSNSTDPNFGDTHHSNPFEDCSHCIHDLPNNNRTAISTIVSATSSLPKLVHEAFEPKSTSSPKPLAHRKTCVKEAKEKHRSGKSEMYGNLKKTIKEFNNNIGNEADRSAVKRAIESMRALGGVPCKGICDDEMPPKVRINDARRGLMYILENLDKTADPKLRVKTLKALQDCLAYPPITENSSDGLLLLANQFREIMHPDLVQGRSTGLQIEILKTFSIFAELIIQSYFAKNSNAIDQRLKEQFIDTIHDLKSFNTNGHNDPVLSFHTEMALEAIKRLKTNRQELLDFLKVLYHSGMSASEIALMVYGEGSAHDMELVSEHIQEALAHVKIYIKKSWYDEWLFIHKELSKSAKYNFNDLELMQIRFVQHYEESNWRFTYAVLELLSDIAINGATPEIRMRALQGNPQMVRMLPGLTAFSNCNHIATKIRARPLMHFKRPKNVDRNLVIRMQCVKELNKIVKESLDPDVRLEAKKALLHRLSCEENLSIKAVLQEIVPSDSAAREKWLKDKGMRALAKDTHHDTSHHRLKPSKGQSHSMSSDRNKRKSISIKNESFSQPSPSLSRESDFGIKRKMNNVHGLPEEDLLYDMICMTKNMSTESREEKDRSPAANVNNNNNNNNNRTTATTTATTLGHTTTETITVKSHHAIRRQSKEG